MGGAVMHNLALALQKNGHFVTGSDDEIYNPAKERLKKAGLLPEKFGWFPEKITKKLDLVILGMHAKADNPELKKAQELGLVIRSFPEFIYQHAKEKTRVVVAGSHGKTTTTAMIMHVLRHAGIAFDYLVGAQLDGFRTMVQLSDAPVMVIEGDEYLSSALDPRPKFLHYRPHLAVITGVAWDHINVFPSYDSYLRQFELLLENMEPEGTVFFYEPDKDLEKIVKASNSNIYVTPYQVFPYRVVLKRARVELLKLGNINLQVFGDHNFANIAAARQVCMALKVPEIVFWQAISSFKGAAKRLQALVSNRKIRAWLDFAHAPSKVKATVEAVKSLDKKNRLVACLELHTFSSLNKAFLPQYHQTLAPADVAAVFYSPHTLEMKKMPPIAPADIRAAFGREDLQVFTERADLEAFIKNQTAGNINLLLMSSGNFGGMDIPGFVAGLS
jgi:UDP-N-acetylmuramate: L-alanyl-gamma-D-glutamyl-meso-diaminopimelate ligase